MEALLGIVNGVQQQRIGRVDWWDVYSLGAQAGIRKEVGRQKVGLSLVLNHGKANERLEKLVETRSNFLNHLCKRDTKKLGPVP